MQRQSGTRWGIAMSAGRVRKSSHNRSSMRLICAAVSMLCRALKPAYTYVPKAITPPSIQMRRPRFVVLEHSA
jgi:hypothetical protein